MKTAAKRSKCPRSSNSAGIITAQSGTMRRYAVVNGDGSSIATRPLAGVFRMVLAGIYERRNRRRAHAEGREEGREEANNAWRDWLRRKEAAAERGETFNEPMPDDGDESDGQAQPMPPKERLRSC